MSQRARARFFVGPEKDASTAFIYNAANARSNAVEVQDANGGEAARKRASKRDARTHKLKKTQNKQANERKERKKEQTQ